ncbi:MAG: hypothetical protein KF805_08995 [Phycisphaeraceae bacterium]|nr:hypothetical protein [Phycisphaeraceae bacterium]
MAITFDRLISTLDQMNLTHFPDPASGATLAPFPTSEGIVLVLIRVECDGEYVAFHTQVPRPGSSHEPRLGELIAEQNYGIRLVQIGAKGDAITASAGLWVCDTQPSEKQFRQYLGNFVTVAAKAIAEIRDACAGRGTFSSAMAANARVV